MATTTTRCRTTIGLMAAILALGGLSACGGDDPGSDGDTTDAATETTDPAGDGSDETSTGEPSDDETSTDAGSGAAFSGDVCTLGADLLQHMVGDGASATPSSPHALFMGQGCTWDGDEQRIYVDVSSANDFVPITDSLLYLPEPVPELGPDAWVQPGGSTSDIAFLHDGVSVYVSAELSASSGTLIEIATAIDADLDAAGV